MRLINVYTRQLEEFFGDSIPPYAILSHTWGQDEVTFQDLATEDHKHKHGYRKIEGCCQAAAEQPLRYVWVDSCCIDKSSSAELSEAINSMFKWYEASTVCFIYLEDLPAGLDPFEMGSAFRKSRWWTRGWTLQELLAPHHIIFFDSNWERVFTPEMSQNHFQRVILPSRLEYVVERPQPQSEEGIQKVEGLQKLIEQIRYGLVTEITGIPSEVLMKELPLAGVSAACKFSWASQRMTTRIEDKAYCLMGLMGVNMPLLYGEGDQAFVRLQEAVISRSDDITLLAWGYNLDWESIEELGYDKILATSPSAFIKYPKSNYRHLRQPPKTHSTVTGHGLHIELPLLLIDARHRIWIGIIEERWDESFGYGESTALVLRRKIAGDTDIFERARGCPVLKIPSLQGRRQLFRSPVSKMVYLQDGGTESRSTTRSSIYDAPSLSHSLFTFMGKSISKGQYTTELAIFIGSLRNVGYRLSSQYPPMNNVATSMFSREAPKWELSGRQIKLGFESPFENLICQGPGTEEFFFVLLNVSGHNLAVKVRIKYNPPYIDSYCVLLSHCSATALEYACDTGLRTYVGKKLHNKLHWSSHINLSTSNKVKINVSACPTQQQLARKNARFAQCSLIWSGGWVSETDEGVDPSQ